MKAGDRVTEVVHCASAKRGVRVCGKGLLVGSDSCQFFTIGAQILSTGRKRRRLNRIGWYMRQRGFSTISPRILRAQKHGAIRCDHAQESEAFLAANK